MGQLSSLGNPQENWWARQDLNLRPMDYESTALTAELQAHACFNLAHTEGLVDVLARFG